jgi:hypothetical protein
MKTFCQAILRRGYVKICIADRFDTFKEINKIA